MPTKQEKEAAFHDAVYSDNSRANIAKFYLLMDRCHEFYGEHLRTNCKNHEVLEIGCGQNSRAVFLSRHGVAQMTGIDISSVAVAQATSAAQRENVERVNFRVMDAERLQFSDNSFDLICGVAILHHLDLDKSLSEISRTLRPGGTAIFLEPMAYNPIINLYRRMTPHLRTEDEHPLTMADLKGALRFFGQVDSTYFHLLSLCAAPLHKMPGFEKVVHFLESADRVLFRLMPFARKYAWSVGLIFSKPLKAPQVAGPSAATAAGRA